MTYGTVQTNYPPRAVDPNSAVRDGTTTRPQNATTDHGLRKPLVLRLI